MAGFIVIEAFTPSTIGSLTKTLAKPKWSGLARSDEDWESLISSGRTTPGGWQRIAVVRPPGKFIVADGFNDSRLPSGVDTVTISIQFVTRSLSFIIGVFSLDDSFGDVSAMLRRDIARSGPEAERISKIYVGGPFGNIRAKIPWARPRNMRMFGSPVFAAEYERKRPYDDLVIGTERSCSDWLSDNFPGQFSAVPHDRRPIMRILITKNEVPLSGDNSPMFRAIGLGGLLGIWRSEQLPGWSIRLGGAVGDTGDAARALAACRREDAARLSAGVSDPKSSASLVYRFYESIYPLVVMWAVNHLIALYVDKFAILRDRHARRKIFRRTARESKAIDKYLMADGLDASTIGSEFYDSRSNVELILRRSPVYVEDISYLPDSIRGSHKPRLLGECLVQSAKYQFEVLVQNIKAATDNFIASASIRQATSNIRLQWIVLLVAVVTLVVAIETLAVA